MTTILRGPKPLAVFKEWGVKPTLVAPEPNTWREVLALVDAQPNLSLASQRVAVQEYGVPNVSLIAGLEARGATVVLTRTSDDGVGPCIDERARIGNQARADAAISIHADGGPATGTGFHVIRPAPMGGPVDAVVEPSTRLAQAIRTAFAAGTATAPATYLSTQDGIVARSDLGGLNLSTVPKVFIETGNMRNAADAARLGDPAFREREAEALADGLQRFLSGG